MTQTQQRVHPLSPPRQSEGAHRVQVTDDDPQPHQGLQAPNSHHGGLNGPPPGDNGLHRGHVTNGLPTTEPPRPSPSTFEKQPPSASAEILRALGAASSPTNAVAALAACSAVPHRPPAEASHETRACCRQRKRSLADHDRPNRVAVVGQPMGVHQIGAEGSLKRSVSSLRSRSPLDDCADSAGVHQFDENPQVTPGNRRDSRTGSRCEANVGSDCRSVCCDGRRHDLLQHVKEA